MKKQFRARMFLAAGMLALPLAAQQVSPTAPAGNSSQASGGNSGQSSEMAVKEETTTAKVAEAAKIRVNVRLVLARVVVRDGSGHAVGNLQKEDFALFDNGKPQVISNFDVEHASAQAAPANATTPGNAAMPQPAQPPAFPSRYVAYLFDDVRLDYGNLAIVREAAKRRLQALPAADRVAIFTTSGQTVLDFTDDREKLRQTLDRLLPHPTIAQESQACDISFYVADLIVNKHDPQALQTVMNQEALDSECGATPAARKAAASLAAPGGGSAASQAALAVEATARQILMIGEQDSRTTLGVLKDAVRRMSGTPGQRNLVLISPGFLTPELEYEYLDVIDRAIRAQVVISSLDARGLYVITPFGDASQRGHPDVNVPGQAYTPAAHSQLDTQAASAQSEIMAVLANSTGGNFFQNSNDMDEGLQRVAELPQTWYVLGFTPQNLKMDGQFHSLKISLKARQKYTLQARTGYYAPSHAVDAAEEAKRELEDELLSSEELHGLPVELHTQFFKPTDDSAKLTVLAHVDVKQLRYRQSDGRNNNELTIVAALFDRNGNLLQAEEKVVQMRWKSETLQGKLGSGITLRSSFDVKPGRYLVRVVARDAEQQMMSAENGAVEIP
jgi:VWFA-related protein